MIGKEQMLKDICVVDFTIVDLMLYLDTHPYDCEAMEMCNHYMKVKMDLCKEFSQSCFPITKDLAESNQEWRWGMAPLPWEGECD